jgi:hypothetical protein
MSKFKIRKVLYFVPLQETYEPNCLYLVRNTAGPGFTVKATSNDGKEIADLFGANIEVYTASGRVHKPVKFWLGDAVTVKGAWTVDYSSAGFTAPPRIIPSAECANAGKAEDGRYASFSFESITTRSASGRVNEAVSLGALVAVVNGIAETRVSIVAIGV